MADAFLQALDDRRLKREAERMTLTKRLAQLNAEGEADAVAKQVYLDMVKDGQISPSEPEPKSPKPDAVEPGPELSTSPNTSEVMVKDMILAVLREAAPLGLTAAQIKAKAYLKFKKHINPNTLTVSLGRYSKPRDGEARLARCEGRTWFYVPANETPKVRTLDLLNGGRHVTQ